MVFAVRQLDEDTRVMPTTESLLIRQIVQEATMAGLWLIIWTMTDCHSAIHKDSDWEAIEMEGERPPAIAAGKPARLEKHLG